MSSWAMSLGIKDMTTISLSSQSTGYARFFWNTIYNTIVKNARSQWLIIDNICPISKKDHPGSAVMVKW